MRPYTITHQLLLCVWWIMTVVLVAIYTSVLTSTLAVRKASLPVNSVEELAKSSMPVVAGKNVAMHGILAAATGGPLKIIHDRVAQNDGFAADYDSMLDHILDNPGTISFFDSYTLHYVGRRLPHLKNIKCEISIINKVITTYSSFIFTKNSPYKRDTCISNR